MRILIAEDDEACRKIMYRFLLPLGDCLACNNGQEAVDAAREALAAQKPFDLVCLDIHMPQMDGHMAAERIRDLESRQTGAAKHRAKIMMVTALGDAVNATNAFDAACDAYIVKPFTYARLMEQIYLMGIIEAPGASPSPATASSHHA